MLAIALVITAVAAVISAAVPLLTITRAPIVRTLRHSSGNLRDGRSRLHGGLVALEVAVATVLVVVAALLGRSFVNLTQVLLGFCRRICWWPACLRRKAPTPT